MMDESNDVGLLLAALWKHERILNELVGKVEGALGRSPTSDKLSYIQALSTINAYVSCIREVSKPGFNGVPEELSFRILAEKFVYTLRSRNLVPDEWTDPLVDYGVSLMS